MLNLKALRIFNRIKSINKNPPPAPQAVWTNPLYFIAFGFGSGAIPFAPGTFGTLLAIPFYLVFAALPLPYYLFLIFILMVLSMWLCEKLSQQIHIHDHPGMNIDEFIGFFVTMIAVPPTPFYIIAGFILFRLFDIFKPWPIRFIDQRIENGVGMILDDVLAGIYACVILHVFAVSIFI